MKKLFSTLFLLSIIQFGYSDFFYHPGFGGWLGGAPSGDVSGQVIQILNGSATLSSDVQAKGIILSSGTTLTINSTSTITLSAELQLGSSSILTISNGSSLSVGTDIENDGTININTGAEMSVVSGIENNSSVIVSLGGNLIQTSTTSNSGTGGTYTITIQGTGSSTESNLWSSPFPSTNLTSTFSSSNPCDMYAFNATSQEWTWDIVGTHTCAGTSYNFDAENMAGADGVMDVARGYTITGGSSKTISGQINNGTFNISVVNNGVVKPDWTGTDWNLVGNPYPSSISASTFLSDNSGRLNGTVYFWDDDGSAGAGYDGGVDYATWNLAGGSGSSSTGGSGVVPNGSIASGQGFFVQAHSSGSISFTNSMREGSNSQFFKSDNKEIIERVWLNATSPRNHVSQILMAFSDSATDGEDWGYDSKRLGSKSDFVFGSIIENETDPFVIQTLDKPAYELNKEVSLSLFTAKAGVTSIEVNNTENLDPNIVVYLKDYQTGKIQNLTTGPFAVYLNANQNYDSRFTLIFANGTGPDPTSVSSIEEAYMIVYHYENTIYLNSKKENLESIYITNLNGSIVSKELLNGTTQTQVDVSHLRSGMYIAKVTTISNRIKYSKFIIK